MSRLVAFYTAFSLGAIPLGTAWVAAHPQTNALWVQLCSSGQFVKLDLGGSKEEPIPPQHQSQACHAVCCRDDDGDGTEKTKERRRSL